jgi:hypothetical protein
MRVEFMSDVGKLNTLILKYLHRCGVKWVCNNATYIMTSQYMPAGNC